MRHRNHQRENSDHFEPESGPESGPRRPSFRGRGPHGRGGGHDRGPRREHFGETGHEGPPPWVARRMRRGDIRTAMLAALQDGPGHGYELMARLGERSGGRWRPSPGSVYPMLQALQDEGLVTSEEADGKRVFSLTEAGVAVAAERVETAGDPWAGDSDDGRGSLWKAVAQFVAAAKQVGVNGSPELLTGAEAIVTDARRKLYQLLAEA